jgi:hypothetical protein
MSNKEAPSSAADEDVVDPWTVTASSNKGIDYNKLIGEPFTSDLHVRPARQTYR